jgi:hypothetical protein
MPNLANQKNMLKQLIGIIGSIAIATTASNPVVAKPSTEASLADFPESTFPPTYILGKNCRTTTKFPPEKIQAVPCKSVTVTGIDDRNPYLYFHFTDEFGNGLAFVTRRFANGKIEPIVAIGKEVNRKVIKLVPVDAPKSQCLTNHGGYKVACLMEYSGAVMMGTIEEDL